MVYGISLLVGIVFSYIQVLPIWVGATYMLAVASLWNLYIWKVNTTHPLFMVVYVSFFSGLWFFIIDESPSVGWAVWFFIVSSVAVFIAWHRSRRYNTRIG